MAYFSDSWVNAFNSIFAALLSGGVAFLSAYWLWRREMSTDETNRREAQYELGRTAGLMIATPLAGLGLILSLLDTHCTGPEGGISRDFPVDRVKDLRLLLDALKGSSEESKRNLERLSTSFSAMEGERILWFTYAELQISRCLALSNAGGFVGSSVSTVQANVGTVLLDGDFVAFVRSLKTRLSVAHRELSAKVPSLEAIAEFQGEDAEVHKYG
nr:hypothetical protein [uncultured Pseudoxanthomonas sp.]